MYTLFLLSYLALAQGNFIEVRQLVERALNFEPESKWGIAQARIIFGRLDWIKGENDQAARQFEEALAISQEIESAWNNSECLNYLGRMALSGGDAHLASSHFNECLRNLLKTLERYHIAQPIEPLASLALLQGDIERAARLLGVANRWGPGFVYTLSPTERAWREEEINEVRTALGESLFTERWEEGRNMPREQAIVYALGSETDLKTTSSPS